MTLGEKGDWELRLVLDRALYPGVPEIRARGDGYLFDLVEGV